MPDCLCDHCAALCCRYFALPIDNPKTSRQFDDIRWYLCHENVVVFIEKKQWYLGIMSRCKHLQSDNRCGIYETRPRICRSYSTDNCDYHGGEYDYEELFTSAEQLWRYATAFLKKRKNRKKYEPAPAAPLGHKHKTRGGVRGHPSAGRARETDGSRRRTAQRDINVVAPFNGNGGGRVALPVLRA